MQELQITRSFKYNSVTLPDPNPALGPDQIREFYASQYPELNNAVVEGPVTRNAVATYTFTRAAGAKGASPHPRAAREVVDTTLAGPDLADPDALLECALDGRHAGAASRIAHVAANTSMTAAPMPLPSAVFGLWG